MGLKLPEADMDAEESVSGSFYYILDRRALFTSLFDAPLS